jgi:argininosuccinate lyase
MPQKRNPVALEHARSIGSRALGQCQAIMLAVHNTPFGDIVDTEDDLQPLVHSAFRDATRMVALVAAAMRDAQFDVEKMRARAEGNFITVTELADTLVRDQGLPFSRTHSIASRLIAKIRQNPDGAVAPMLAEVSKDVTGRAIEYPEDRLRKILSPAHFVEIRKTLGGPAPEVTAAAIEVSRAALEQDRAWLQQREDALANAVRRQRAEVERL